MQEVSPVLKNAPNTVVIMPTPKWQSLWRDETAEVGKITSPYELDEFIPSVDNRSLDRTGLVTPYCYDISEGGRCLYTRNARCTLELMALFQPSGALVPSMTIQLWAFDWTSPMRAKAAVSGGEQPGLPYPGEDRSSVALGLSWPLHRKAQENADSFTLTGVNGGDSNDQVRVSFGANGLVFGDADASDWVPSLISSFCPVGVYAVFPWVVTLTNCEEAALLVRAV